MGKNSGTCCVEECGRRAAARGMCNAHYKRYLKFGSPTAGMTFKGEPLAWFDRHQCHSGNACLIWPFARDGDGYASIFLEGKQQRVHRLYCQLLNGPPPSLDSQAAHSCGKGHEGCCNPRHVRWATVQENMDDKIVHGTLPVGSAHPRARLNEHAVAEIRAMRGRMTQSDIAKRFGITRTAVGDIQRCRIWKSVR